MKLKHDLLLEMVLSGSQKLSGHPSNNAVGQPAQKLAKLTAVADQNFRMRV